jgi:polysaccharide export outer membrane protein
MKKLKWRVLFATVFLLQVNASPARGQEGDKKPPAPSESAKQPEKNIKADEPSVNGYTIGEQDVLDIVVWREKDFSGPVVVRPDGKITVPLVGEIYVVGTTPVQLQETLMEKLKPFVNTPQVTVSVREINSRKVYLMGHVAHEGAFRISGSTTLSELIAEAGGLQPFAKRKKIYILRNVNGKQTKLLFDYDAFIKGEAKSEDLILNPGDKIVVP